jgi:hypothetical protein
MVQDCCCYYCTAIQGGLYFRLMWNVVASSWGDLTCERVTKFGHVVNGALHVASFLVAPTTATPVGATQYVIRRQHVNWTRCAVLDVSSATPGSVLRPAAAASSALAQMTVEWSMVEGNSGRNIMHGYKLGAGSVSIFSHVHFIGNSIAGGDNMIYGYAAASSMPVTDCVFRGNTAGNDVGYAQSVTGCSFDRPAANAIYAGTIAVSSGNTYSDTGVIALAIDAPVCSVACEPPVVISEERIEHTS